jgi:hypothetical protein
MEQLFAHIFGDSHSPNAIGCDEQIMVDHCRAWFTYCFTLLVFLPLTNQLEMNIGDWRYTFVLDRFPIIIRRMILFQEIMLVPSLKFVPFNKCEATVITITFSTKLLLKSHTPTKRMKWPELLHFRTSKPFLIWKPNQINSYYLAADDDNWLWLWIHWCSSWTSVVRKDYSQLEDVDVHGGLTYLPNLMLGKEPLWWILRIGFDTAHTTETIYMNCDERYCQNQIEHLKQQWH